MSQGVRGSRERDAMRRVSGRAGRACRLAVRMLRVRGLHGGVLGAPHLRVGGVGG